MSPEGITFRAADGLSVSADLYSVSKARAFLVLCHRSHFHRGEYVEGARCLWAKTARSGEYWKAFLAFLEGALE